MIKKNENGEKRICITKKESDTKSKVEFIHNINLTHLVFNFY